MAIDKGDFRKLIRKTLQKSGLWSQNAEELLMLTAAAESELGTYVYQRRGPAKGFFQMEPATHNDIVSNFLYYRLERFKPTAIDILTPMNVDRLETDIEYMILMARIHYLRVADPIPTLADAQSYREYITELAEYWKRHYNTILGKGTVQAALSKYNTFVLNYNT